MHPNTVQAISYLTLKYLQDQKGHDTMRVKSVGLVHHWLCCIPTFREFDNAKMNGMV